MNKEKEEILKKLNIVKQQAQEDINKNHPGYEVKDVIYYHKKIELENEETGEKEESNLCDILIEDPDTKEVYELYYLVSGEELEKLEIKEVELEELLKNQELNKSIRDVIEDTKKNEEKSEEEQDEKLKKESLEELEEEKEKEESEEKEQEEDSKEKVKKDAKEESKNDLTGTDPKYVMQTIDIDQAYIDEWTTVRQGYGLPPEVEEIAIATPTQKDDHILSDTMSIYMLDNQGKIIENVKGKTIKDYFEIDDATGHNPTNDDNTKLELDGHAEVDQDQTMRRFKSKENPDLYLSIEQKEIGGYHEVYAGQKTTDGNDAVEIQLETRNVEIQTDLEMQKIISGRKGIYNKEEIDKEAELHTEHGDDEEEVAIENSDGDKHTRVVCDSPYVPDTEITWEQLSKIMGDKDVKQLTEEFFEQYDGNNGQELVLRMQAEYKEKENLEIDRDENIDIDEGGDNNVYLVITKDTEVPERDMSVEEWAEELGESVEVIVDRLQREIEKNDGRKPIDIVEEIENDYEMAGHEHRH